MINSMLIKSCLQSFQCFGSYNLIHADSCKTKKLQNKPNLSFTMICGVFQLLVVMDIQKVGDLSRSITTKLPMASEGNMEK